MSVFFYVLKSGMAYLYHFEGIFTAHATWELFFNIQMPRLYLLPPHEEPVIWTRFFERPRNRNP